MQKDFHYYGTYVLARAAGIKKNHAQIIASAAQFVDDSISRKHYRFNSGGSLKSVVTAHHASSFENIDEDDQRSVWVPFHFLPGGAGESWTEKLICLKNSRIAQEMVANALNAEETNHSDYLIGITAHVYADTFAHYGFSGISSRRNKIRNNSIELEVENPRIREYIEKKAKSFLSENQKSYIIKNIRSFISGAVEIASGALGHGAVATYPDRPYLRWKFAYEMERIPEHKLHERDNRITFLEASEKLFVMFKRYGEKHEEVRDDTYHLAFSDISDEIQRIINTEGACKERVREWEESVGKKNGLPGGGKENSPLSRKGMDPRDRKDRG